MAPRHTNTDEFSEQEAQQRFMAALKAAVNTKPKPLKSMTPKGTRAQSKKHPKKAKRVGVSGAS